MPSSSSDARCWPRVPMACSCAPLPPSLIAHSTPACLRDAARPLTSVRRGSSSRPASRENGCGDAIQRTASSAASSNTMESTMRGRRRARMACRINCRPPRHPPNPGSARMVTLGTPLSPHATRVLLLGSGELGKEVAIELQRFGAEVIAADRYPDARAMQVAHRSHVLDMLDGAGVRALVERERPHLVVPEIEAIHTETLVALEQEFAAAGDGRRVIPTARAARLTMDREGIRRLAAETLGIPTSPYRFVDTREDYQAAIAAIGLPCVVKPVMSSSGKGQSLVRTSED